MMNETKNKSKRFALEWWWWWSVVEELVVLLGDDVS